MLSVSAADAEGDLTSLQEEYVCYFNPLVYNNTKARFTACEERLDTFRRLPTDDLASIAVAAAESSAIVAPRTVPSSTRVTLSMILPMQSHRQPPRPRSAFASLVMKR